VRAHASAPVHAFCVCGPMLYGIWILLLWSYVMFETRLTDTRVVFF